MRLSPVMIGLALGLAAAAAPTVRSDDALAPTTIERTLSGIDYLPDRATLSTVLAGDLDQLIAVADDAAAGLNPGVRIRAYRSLGLFQDDRARVGLTAAILRYRNSEEPVEQLYLIAALEALGAIGGDAQVPTLSGSLGHDRRDVRAAAARALGATHDQGACSALQSQRRSEPAGQVRLDIDQAIHDLGPLCSFGFD